MLVLFYFLFSERSTNLVVLEDSGEVAFVSEQFKSYSISKLRLCIFSKVTIKCFHTSMQFLIVDPSHYFMRCRLISNVPILSIFYIEVAR